jgi:hypothetical protein
MEVLNNLSPKKVGFADDNKEDFVNRAIGIGLSVAVLFATVWVVGRAWKQSQKA